MKTGENKLSEITHISNYWKGTPSLNFLGTVQPDILIRVATPLAKLKKVVYFVTIACILDIYSNGIYKAYLTLERPRVSD